MLVVRNAGCEVLGATRADANPPPPPSSLPILITSAIPDHSVAPVRAMSALTRLSWDIHGTLDASIRAPLLVVAEPGACQASQLARQNKDNK